VTEEKKHAEREIERVLPRYWLMKKERMKLLNSSVRRLVTVRRYFDPVCPFVPFLISYESSRQAECTELNSSAKRSA